jgi:cytochrome P450
MFSTLPDEEIITIKGDVETMIHYTSAAQSNPFRPPLWIRVGENARFLEARERVHKFINNVIAARRAVPEAEWPDDLLSKLMQARDPESGASIPDSLLRDESITIFFAGHETTARTLTFMFYALAKNPDVAARLHAEVIHVLGSHPQDVPPSIDDLKQLPYTLQVIKETLRLYPPAPMYVRDAVGEDVIDGIPISPGTQMMLLPFATHRHPDFWDHPEKFDPDRWTPEAEAARHPYAYHPFAAGQRICIGNNFSLFESHILTAMLARRFIARLVPADHEVQLEMAGTLYSKNGVPMQIELN